MAERVQEKRLKKVLKYIKGERPKKLKDYVQKHDINLGELTVEGGGNLLHYCVQHNSTGIILQYLLESGVCPEGVDAWMNVPLHLALQRAGSLPPSEVLEYVEAVVSPLMARSERGLWKRNKAGILCLDLWESLKERLKKKEEKKESWSSSDRPSTSGAQKREPIWEDDFIDRLLNASEADDEDRFHNEFDSWLDDSDENESYDEWCDRITRERERKEYFARYSFPKAPPRKKPRRQAPPPFPHSPPPQPPPPPPQGRQMPNTAYWAQPNHQKQRSEGLRSRTRYETSFKARVASLSSLEGKKLTFGEIPWPADSATKSVEVLLAGLVPRTVEYRRYLREQQVRWHPDKFRQKFGEHLAEKDTERIMKSVTELSQRLNLLSEA